MQVDDLSQSQGILIDLGCGENKQKGFVGIDARDVEGVDIVHDLEVFPWPLHDECALTVIASHLIEHIKPWLSIQFMDEIWRVLKMGGDVALSTPYAGSAGYWQDPTHCNGWTQASFQYFDPRYPLYQIYKPKPFLIRKGYPVWQAAGNMEIVLTKIAEDTVDHWREKGFTIIPESADEATEEVIAKEITKSAPDLGICVSDEIKITDKMGGGKNG